MKVGLVNKGSPKLPRVRVPLSLPPPFVFTSERGPQAQPGRCLRLQRPGVTACADGPKGRRYEEARKTTAAGIDTSRDNRSPPRPATISPKAVVTMSATSVARKGRPATHRGNKKHTADANPTSGRDNNASSLVSHRASPRRPKMLPSRRSSSKAAAHAPMNPRVTVRRSVISSPNRSFSAMSSMGPSPRRFEPMIRYLPRAATKHWTAAVRGGPRVFVRRRPGLRTPPARSGAPVFPQNAIRLEALIAVLSRNGRVCHRVIQAS